MKLIAQHIVPENTERIRLSEYGRDLFEALPSRKSVKKAIKEKRLLINGQIGQTGDWVQEGMLIQLLAPEQLNHKSYDLKLEIIFEDDYLALINKPAGIPVSGNQFRTIKNCLPGNLQISEQIDALKQANPLHRLDSLTSGLLLIAKTAKAQLKLSQDFAARKIQKNYEAILSGIAPESGTITSPVDSRQAKSTYKRLQLSPSLINDQLSWVQFSPETGRTHQIRIHAASIGCPIMGDQLYGIPGKIYKGKGLFLCATGLQFLHPISAEQLSFHIAPPAKFQRLVERETKMWQKYHDDK